MPSQPDTSSRRGDAKPTPAAKTSAKSLPKAAIEATAEAFFAGFQALPGAVRWRIVQLIEEHEDELDAQELAAARLANPADFDPRNAVPWEQVKAEMNAQATTPQKAA